METGEDARRGETNSGRELPLGSDTRGLGFVTLIFLEPPETGVAGMADASWIARRSARSASNCWVPVFIVILAVVCGEQCSAWKLDRVLGGTLYEEQELLEARGWREKCLFISPHLPRSCGGLSS